MIEADPAAATNLLRHTYGLAIMLPLRQVPELLPLATCIRCGGHVPAVEQCESCCHWRTCIKCGGHVSVVEDIGVRCGGV